MSSSETLEPKLEALQCHFTWDVEPQRSKLFYLRDSMKDVSTDEGNFWLGPIYNLQGFIHYKLGSTEEALRSFNQAAETFQRQKHADEGPWLMVNFGDLAWLHHLMGEDEKSQDYLSKVEALRRRYPAPPEEKEKEEEELHPEVCAEKAWALMKFDREKKLQAAELFQRAVQMQPDAVEWQSSYAILRGEAFKDNLKNLYNERLEILRSAKERDPDNLCVAALYLEARALKGEVVQEEVQGLAKQLKERPAGGYSGISPLLRLNRRFKPEDTTEEPADEALRQTQDRRSAAEAMAKKIFSKDYKPDPRDTDEAIRLWEEVIDADPGFSLQDQITLASIYAKVDIKKADNVYEELLRRENLDPAEKQILYNRYAKHMYFIRKEKVNSTEYHMKAAEIPVESSTRQSSITELKKTLNRKQDSALCRKISELLARLGK